MRGGVISNSGPGYANTASFDVNNADCVCVDTVTNSGLPYRYFVVKSGAQQGTDLSWSVGSAGRDCNILFYPSACNTGLMDDGPVKSYGPGKIPTGTGEPLTGVTRIQPGDDSSGFASYEVCCFDVVNVPQQSPPELLVEIDRLATDALVQESANFALNPFAYEWLLPIGSIGGRRLMKDLRLNVTQLQHSSRCCRACICSVMLLALTVPEPASTTQA